MKQYRPTIEEFKLRYSQMLAQRKMTERRHAAKPGLANLKPIPDNSEPWLPHKPRSLAKCMRVADQFSQRVEQWKSDLLPTPLSPP